MQTKLPVFNFKVNNQKEDVLDIFIDGDIVDASTQDFLKTYYGEETSTSYKSFRNQVETSSAKTINVYINSGGGQLMEAMAIHDLLIDLQHKGKSVNTFGRGIIASAATYILLAGKSPSMSTNSFLMIHNVSGATWGEVNDIENYAASLRKFNNTVNAFYQNTTGLSESEITQMMDSETWLTAKEAKDKNFIKEVTNEVTFKNSITPDRWLFQNQAILNSYNSFTNKTIQMDTSKITEAITNGFNTLLEKIGLADKSKDENIKNALNDFSKTITNAIEEKEQSISNVVKVEVENQVKKITEGDDFKNAVNGVLKTIPENFTNAINEAVKNTASKEDLKSEMTKMTKAITDKLGQRSNGDEDQGRKKQVAQNRFAEAYENYY